MAIIVDPDDLDRNQVVYGSEIRDISLYPVGAVITGAYDPERSTGETVTTGVFQDPGALYQTEGIAAGDIFTLKTGNDAGHYEVVTVISETQVFLDLPDAQAGWNVDGETGIFYDARNPVGGSAVDGVTEQAVYSFGKEEWRADSETYGGDDLIKHPFPYEPITREQFEIGGGTAHDLWDYFRDDTRQRVRTGGWAVVSGTTTDQIYAGVLTLGALDSDAQVYYLQIATGTAPVDFVLPGTVNQAVNVFQNGGLDLRSFLKLFVRKKFRTYAQSDLDAIGVTQLESLVNRFPLTHAVDPAIVAVDAEIIGNTPFTGFSNISNNTNGVTSNPSTDVGRLTSAGHDFTADGVQIGDVLFISTGATDDGGYFRIITVGTTTVDVDLVENGAFTGESSLTFQVNTRRIIDEIADDGTIAQEQPASPTGTLTSIAGGFSGTVAAGDVLSITEAGSANEGVYEITQVLSDTQIEVDTSDQAFPTGAVGSIDFAIFEPGFFLQYKEEDVPLAATGDLTFTDQGASPNEDTIDRASGSWITDAVAVGDLITISGSVSNDGSYVVREIVSAAQIRVDVEHELTTEGPVGATATVARLFTRDISGELYPFHWRLFGNDSTLSNHYQFIQRALRQTTDIDEGPSFSRGDITDLLMEFATPTGNPLDLFIDDLNSNDINNATFEDASGEDRNFDFVAAGTIEFNNNLQADAQAVYEMFFLSTPQGNYGTPQAITVQDSTSVDISGNVGGAPSVSWDFAYDSNAQGGRTPATDASIVLVAIGLQTAQFVRFDGTITRATGQTFSLVSALERNYSNP
jgi:hypothetical protein